MITTGSSTGDTAGYETEWSCDATWDMLAAAYPRIRAQVYAEIRQLAIAAVERSVKAGFDATALIRFVADLIGGGETGA